MEPDSKRLKQNGHSKEAVKVACLGPLGTYSHQATTEFFGDDSDLSTCNEIADVFKAVESRAVRYGVVPIENSSFGPVQETMARLRSTRLSVRGMTKLKIGHALMSNTPRVKRPRSAAHDAHESQKNSVAPDQSPNSSVPVLRIYSHEQAIGQCKGYLARYYDGAQIVSVTSTAKAALLAKDDNQALAVCSLKCAQVYQLHVIDTDIQDAGADNTTRFIVLSQPGDELDSRFPLSTTLRD
ncbi:prephenate dehydratase [Microbotryomycetes sp. JL201]|nr:prephenate dehydratase [Microbotryomycetes sp. JL201]